MRRSQPPHAVSPEKPQILAQINAWSGDASRLEQTSGICHNTRAMQHGLVARLEISRDQAIS